MPQSAIAFAARISRSDRSSESTVAANPAGSGAARLAITITTGAQADAGAAANRTSTIIPQRMPGAFSVIPYTGRGETAGDVIA